MISNHLDPDKPVHPLFPKPRRPRLPSPSVHPPRPQVIPAGPFRASRAPSRGPQEVVHSGFGEARLQLRAAPSLVWPASRRNCQPSGWR